MIQVVTSDDLQTLARRAAESDRGRTNQNLHPTLDDPIQRLLNAISPGSYVRPHRHNNPARWELFTLVLGGAVVLTFTDDGTVHERVDLSRSGATTVEIPAGAWHTVAATAEATVLLEVKPGPYLQVSDKDFVPWAPDEASPGAADLERWFQRARPGERWPGRTPLQEEAR